jgi:CheY-like chemotaxis protein
VEAFLSGPADRFEAILMDLDMPVMDGHEAALAIRAAPGGSAVPIVALTAHAVSEVRERCVGEGMSDFLPKPIRPRHLYALLRRLFGGPGAGGRDDVVEDSASAETAGHVAGHAIDTVVGLDHMEGDRAFYFDILKCFSQEYGGLAGEFEDRLAARDWRALELKAHSLKGLAATIGALELSESSRRLELMAKAPEGVDEDALAQSVREVEALLAEAIAEAKADVELASRAGENAP